MANNHGRDPLLFVAGNFVANARGRQLTMIGFGNVFHSTGYAFWYLTKDLPKKEEAPVLKW